MSYSVLPAGEAFWRPTPAKVLNTDLAQQLGAQTLGARLWRLKPGQATTKHRHFAETELYVVLDGEGRMRIGEDSLSLPRLSAVLVEPDTVRQVFNDTEAEVLWLVVGAPPDEITPERQAAMYPDGPQALPPELTG